MTAGDGLPRAFDSVDVWLEKAVEHLVAACGLPASATAEIGAGVVPGSRAIRPGAEAYLERLDASRLCIVCTALAAEAKVNAYVHAMRPGYRPTLEKLSIPERWSLAPQLLSGTNPFPPGSRVYEHLGRLFALRDELAQVWPRPAASGDPVDAGLGARVGPHVAWELLDSVARGAKILGELYEHHRGPSIVLALKATEALERHAAAAGAVPAPTLAELAEEDRLAAGFAEELIGA